MNDKNPAAIVCAGSMASSVVAARSLGRRGVPVVTVAFDRGDKLLRTKYSTESHVITSPREDYDRFADSLAAIADQDHVGTFVPLNEYDIYTVVRRHGRFADTLNLPLVDAETLETVQDRKALFELAESLDISVPRTGTLRGWNRWNEPSIIKPRYSMIEHEGRLSAPDVQIVNPGERPVVEEVKAEMGHEPLVQQYVTDGTEFGFFALCKNGAPLETFQHRRVRSTNYYGGASSHRRAVDIPRLRTLGERILRELDWHGPAMVEFRRNDETGAYELMEINPRFWGSLALPITAGVDFPWHYYQLTRGEVVETDGYTEGVTASYLRAELQYLASLWFDEFPSFVERPSRIGEVLPMAASLPGTNFDMMSRDDPLPFIWDYLEATKTVLNRMR